jgi:hypothetical protein
MPPGAGQQTALAIPPTRYITNRADAAATSRDTEACVSLFTADAVLDGSKGRYPAAAVLRESVGSIWPLTVPSAANAPGSASRDHSV